MSNKKTLSFQTEVKQLLNLMINSLYSNKDIFLRELISNASDAIDKLKFEQISNSQLNKDEELFIEVSVNKEDKTITISDNGIGMSYNEVIENIGTIANSGTKKFLNSLSGDAKKDNNLIGQFGVGFYSAFIVAKSIELHTLKAGEQNSKAVVWTSDGTGEFTIENANKENHGTTILLHLKDDCEEFLVDWKLRSLIKTYSDHINYPIKMLKATEYDKDDKEIISTELETVNQANALWVRNKSNISTQEYKEFYKHISNDYNDPLVWTHNKVEGTQEYTQLLYIPSKAPFDLYDAKKRYGIKLYIKRVFIMDDAEKLLPNYLRFVRGIIDSQDLPLNISREILQSSKDIENIRTGSTKKILSIIEDLAKKEPDSFNTFYKEFGNVFKEGIVEDFTNKNKIASLLRFISTNSDSELANTSLDEYIKRMKANQDKIYFITADSYKSAKNSPHLEVFYKNNIEVLLLVDRIDEWVVSHLTKYEDKDLISVASTGLDISKIINESEKERENKKEQTKPLIEKIKKALGDKVKDVQNTTRLVNSPSCLLVDQNSMSIHMEQILKQAGQSIPPSKPILEINSEHPLVKKLESSESEEQDANISQILLDQAVLMEGLSLDDPSTFILRMNKLICS